LGGEFGVYIGYEFITGEWVGGEGYIKGGEDGGGEGEGVEVGRESVLVGLWADDFSFGE
jgi:hypothetical protein